MAKVEPIPSGYPRVMPYLSIDGAAAAIDFYKTVFDAVERVRMNAPGGKIGHAELDIGGSIVMLADAFPEMGGKTPQMLGGTPVSMMIYVEDVDNVFKNALMNGATEMRPVENQFYGDRAGQFADPFGHHWFIATHVEDVPEDEMMRRAQEMMGG